MTTSPTRQADSWPSQHMGNTSPGPGRRIAGIAVREITGLSAHIRTAPYKPFTREQLAYRLDTLRRGETTARWLFPPG